MARKTNYFDLVFNTVPTQLGGFPLKTPDYSLSERFRIMFENQEGTVELRYADNDQTFLRQGVLVNLHLKRTVEGQLKYEFGFNLIRNKRMGRKEVDISIRLLRELGDWIDRVDALAREHSRPVKGSSPTAVVEELKPTSLSDVRKKFAKQSGNR